MTNPYRTMCAELVDVVYEYCILHEGRDHLQPLIDRARALLAEPVAEGPKPVVDYSRVTEIATEAQIRSAAQYLVKKRNCDGDLIPAIEYAIARWGRPTSQQEPERPTEEDLEHLADVMNVSGNPVPAMRRALELWGRSMPQPVAEGVLPLKERPDFIAGYGEGLADGRRIIEREEAERPTPQPPADGEVAELVAWLQDRADSTSIAANANRASRIADLLQHQHPQPAAEGPTDEELLRLAREWNSGFESIELHFAADYARAVLDKWGHQ
jgi:hypothetical protein